MEKEENLKDKKFIQNFWNFFKKDLEKREVNINVFDFDDTLKSRIPELKNEKFLYENRGDKGPEALGESLERLEYYFGKYYNSEENLTKEIFKNFNKEFDLILTAGIFEFQFIKLLKTGLTKNNFLIVPKAEDKIIELIRYVIFKLQFLPKSITIYEDRPNHFIENRKFLEEILECKIIIKFAQINGENKVIKLEEV